MRVVTRSAYVVASSPLLATAAGPGGLAEQGKPASPAKPDDRTIVHVLNRLGFGPAPGDVERVRAIGLAAYIDQQLHPERIDDCGMTTRLAAFETLTKSTREMARGVLPAGADGPTRACSGSRRRKTRRQDPAMTAPPQIRRRAPAQNDDAGTDRGRPHGAAGARPS